MLSGFKHKIAINSITEGVLSKNSSDLGLGRCPIAISDEFVESTPPSYRDIDVPFSDFFRKRYIVRERDPFARCNAPNHPEDCPKKRHIETYD